MDVGRNFTLMEFGGISGLVKSSKFLRYRVDINRNFRLIDFSRFFRFLFKIRAVRYRIFLLIIRGSK